MHRLEDATKTSGHSVGNGGGWPWRPSLGMFVQKELMSSIRLFSNTGAKLCTFHAIRYSEIMILYGVPLFVVKLDLSTSPLHPNLPRSQIGSAGVSLRFYLNSRRKYSDCMNDRGDSRSSSQRLRRLEWHTAFSVYYVPIPLHRSLYSGRSHRYSHVG